MSGQSPLSCAEFVIEVEQRLQAEPAIDFLGREGEVIQVRAGQRRLRIDIKPFYNAYTQAPEHFDLVYATLLRVLYEQVPAREAKTFSEVAQRVLPMLKPIVLLNAVFEKKLPMLAYRPFLADLIITYVIDEPQTVAYINERHLERWGIGEHVLHEQALTNLAARTQERARFLVTGEGAQRLIIANSQDGYDATRILLPNLLASWQPHFPGTMVIGIPNRDFLIAFSDADESILTSVAHQIQLDAAQRDNGLTDQLFTIEDGQVREYHWV
ncbi:MAG TPA: DUF1444 domain-containing protein [Chloroflexus aurantiacus]|jgi:uncharacterized protein YtpQ (UPF0354 family)|uniref:DUF1444 family protein n=1 Tax=Chloroflexus aurantiacus (strain ATCC 29366 / DSM 635 / J-10-fl) TaxID=324602 RepID=A9WJT5_CHLAA|nr:MULTISPECIES: DUF1444 family protein [Chloroflexus]ABY36551.1 conserved hypothetical protein [Chloroflexus aurantiacus J-10-fl]HBW68006.1 DUF1444 domain-containing protein [Chloroflexus aurantiacus]